MLHDGVVESLRCERIAYRLQFDRLLVADLDDATAGKIDTDIEFQCKQADHGHQQQCRRQHHRRLAQAHEIEVVE
jgi:hypothetical protein